MRSVMMWSCSSWIVLAAGLAALTSTASAGLLPLAETDDVVITEPQGHGPEQPQVIAYVTYDTSSKKYTVTTLNTDDPEEAEGLIPADYLAKAIYRNLINETGWAYLELQTNVAADDEMQANAAGVIEGYLSADILHMHVANVARPFCDGRQQLCRRIYDFLKQNEVWVGRTSKAQEKTDVYWRQVRLFYYQQMNLITGYDLRRTEDPSLPELNGGDILFLNVQGDLEDLVEALALDESDPAGKPKPTLMERGRVLGSGSCSALVKLLPGAKDILVSHDTWSSYETMLRVQKKYVLNYHMGPGRAELLPGRAMSFSSYPGVLTSGDDFYVMSSGLVTMETTIGNGNASLWQHVKAVGQVAEGTRSMVANRLATSGRMWTQIFSKFNSGTYNNQWMVVDYDRLVPDRARRAPKSGLLYVLEQLPGYIRAEDMTAKLLADGYWASYNVPYFEDVFTMGGNVPLARKYGDWFTYENSPRARIFRREQGKVTDLQSMWRLMRSNDFKNDPLSACNCTPSHNGENAIAARSDLNPADGKYPWGALGHRNHGATDTKITSKELAAALRFLGESGPPHYSPSCPPFSWSKADFAATTPHQGLPDTWTFPPVTHTWAWGEEQF